MNRWDDLYQDQRMWLRWPDELVVRFTQKTLKPGGARRILDLGCGGGRHTVYLLKEGFAVSAIDSSSQSLEVLTQWIVEEGLSAGLACGSMTALPYADATFDAVLAWNVLFYSIPDELQRSLDEVYRVLRPSGILFGTLLAAEDWRSQTAARLGPTLYRGTQGDHTGMIFQAYATEAEARACFLRFPKLTLGHTAWAFGELDRQAAHWVVAAEKNEANP